MDSTQLLINELTARLGAAHAEAAGWKVRASIAERSLADLEAMQGATDEMGMVPEDYADEAIEDILEKGHGGTE